MIAKLKWLARLAKSFLIEPTAYARSLGVKVGTGCRLYIRSWGTEPFLITIGDRVTIASGTRIITHDGSTWLMRDEQGRRYLYSPVTIGSDVFIGVNCVILPGVTIGDRVVIGAGSVVTRDIPSGHVAAGSPARVLGTFDDYQAKVFTRSASEADLADCDGYRARIDRAMVIQAERSTRAW